MLFNMIFPRFFFVLASENDVKIEVFSLLFRKRRFCKNHGFPLRGNHYFSSFERPKNDKKSMPKHTQKKHRKKPSQKPILASILASENLPKSTENRKKSKKTPSKKRLRKRGYGTHAPDPAPHPENPLGAPWGRSNHKYIY